MLLNLQDHNSCDAAEMLFSGHAATGSVIGLTSGCYDLYHIYHLEYFVRCRRLCDMLVVGVNSDRLVKEEKDDSRPIFPESDRLKIVESIGIVDIAFVMDSIDDFAAAAKLLGVDKIFKNDAFRDRTDVAGTDQADLVIVPDVEQLTSTTSVINRIQRIKEDGK